MTDDVPPPEGDDLFDKNRATSDEDDRQEPGEAMQVAQAAATQAQQFHAMMDSAKRWSHETEIEICVLAATEGDESEETSGLIEFISSVRSRIEHGDQTRSRGPGR